MVKFFNQEDNIHLTEGSADLYVTTKEDSEKQAPFYIRSKLNMDVNKRSNDEFKYRKKTYHISVRNKISPHILKLENNTTKNFDKKVNATNRQQICRMLR